MVDRMVQLLREESMSKRVVFFATALIFVVVVSVAELMRHLREAEEVSQHKGATLAFASELRARADRELNSVLYLASGIVGYLAVRHDRMDRDEIEHILAEVHASGRHVRNFSIAVGYRVAYVYPPAGNQQAMGLDYRTVATQWPAVKAAVDSGKGVLTGPVRLVQGGTALIYRLPVLVDGKYWGMLSTVIDMPSLGMGAFSGLDEARFEFAVRGDEPPELGGGMLFGRSELFSDPSSVLLEAEVPNGKWVYAVRPRGQVAAGTVAAIRIGGWVIALLFAAGVYTVLRQRSELARQAGFDPLTGLPNRRLFDDRLEQAIRRQSRNVATQVAVVFLDLNGFKAINDQYGHKFGDVVLNNVAMRVRDEIRLGDTVARWAGDEFAVVIEEASERAVGLLIQRLRSRIAEPLEVDGVALGVTSSMGVAYYPGEAATAAELLDLADQRMFADKENAKAA